LARILFDDAQQFALLTFVQPARSQHGQFNLLDIQRGILGEESTACLTPMPEGSQRREMAADRVRARSHFKKMIAIRAHIRRSGGFQRTRHPLFELLQVVAVPMHGLRGTIPVNQIHLKLI
jgi:hypothetical protein